MNVHWLPRVSPSKGTEQNASPKALFQKEYESKIHDLKDRNKNKAPDELPTPQTKKCTILEGIPSKCNIKLVHLDTLISPPKKNGKSHFSWHKKSRIYGVTFCWKTGLSTSTQTPPTIQPPGPPFPLVAAFVEVPWQPDGPQTTKWARTKNPGITLYGCFSKK